MHLHSGKVLLKDNIKLAANFAGLDLHRLGKSPRYSLLGIRKLPIKTVIDVGANRGQFAAYIRGIFPQARLYCFEPLPKPFQELHHWATGQKNVELFNLALGASDGTTKMFHHIEHNASSSLLATTVHSEELFPLTQKQELVSVQLRTLDNVINISTEGLKPDILVKVDVQGYEEHVIEGGRRLFSQARACIIEISLDELYSGQADFKRLVLMLYDIGFRYVGNLEQSYDEDGRVIFFDAVFLQ